VWQGEDEWEEGVGVEEDQAATLAHAEQVRATQSSRRASGSDEVTKAVSTQATPSAHSSSSSSSSSSDSG